MHHVLLYIGKRVWSCVRNPNAASFYVGRLKFLEQQNKMGTAKMGPLIFSMALPAMISMIINSLYNIVDSIFVAKYSQDALAAVSLVYPLQMLVVAIGVGTGVGVNSLIARRLGEKRQKHADSAAEHGVALAVVGGIAFFILGWGFSGVFVGAFGASEAVSAYAIQCTAPAGFRLSGTDAAHGVERPPYRSLERRTVAASTPRPRHCFQTRCSDTG